MKTTLCIPQSLLGEFGKRILKLNRLATKVGAGKVVETFEGSVLRVRKAGDAKRWGTDNAFCTPIEVFTANIYNVECETICRDGWSLGAVIDFGGLVRRFPDCKEDIDFTSYVGRDTCDHCNTDRDRKQTFLCYHADGTIKQIGSTCLQEFVGVEPEKVLRLLEEFKGLADIEDEDPDGDFPLGGGINRGSIGLSTFLAYTQAIIAKFGYIGSKKAEEEGLTTTATWVISELCSVAPIVTPDYTDVPRIIEYWKNIEPKSEFERNCQHLAECSFVTLRSIGFAAWLAEGWRRHIAEQLLKDCPQGDFVGHLGDKVEFEAQVVKERTVWGNYGATQVCVLKDEQGNLYEWWNSSKVTLELEGKYSIKGTVKAHKEFRGDRLTVLARCKAVSLVVA